MTSIDTPADATATAGGVSRQRRRVLRPAMVVAFGGVALAGVWLGLSLRPDLPGDNSAEAGFARDMGVHHAQAVAMAEAVRERTPDPELRALCADVALTQQAQIGKFDGWLEAWGLPKRGREPPMAWMDHRQKGRMPGMATAAEVSALRQKQPEQAEVDFLRLMISHHKGAVAMARGVLGRTERSEVRRLARAIVESQRAEISAMESMLVRRGASTEAPGPTDPDAGAGDHG